MQEFMPTWLYIKKHNITGLRYFGKTIKTNPEKYNGSGKYWKSHLRTHGNDVSTIWCELFTDRETLVEYALSFSKDNNIFESKDWANLKFENGLDGGHSGVPRSETTKRKLSIINTGRMHSSDTKEKISSSNIGKHNIPKSDEAKRKMSVSRLGKKMGPMSEETKIKIGNANRGKPSDRKGVPMSEETKIKIGNANRGKPSDRKGVARTEDEKQKISQAIKNSLKIECPHCKLNGLAGCMRRWHFDNCKRK